MGAETRRLKDLLHKMKPQMNTDEHRSVPLSRKSFRKLGRISRSFLSPQRRGVRREVCFCRFFLCDLRVSAVDFLVVLGRSVFICVHLWFHLCFWLRLKSLC